MAMSRNTAIGSLVCGAIMVCFAVVAVICGAISFHKLSDKAATSAGLWSIYVFVPGIFSIVAGAKKNDIVMGFALFFNVVAAIISAVASIILIVFIATLNIVLHDANNCHMDSYGSCVCIYNHYTVTTTTWDVKCSELGALHSLMSVLLAVYLILLVVCFTASILGCIGTCCAPPDPIVVVTTGVPFQVSRGAVILSSNQSTMNAVYSGQVMPAAYVQPPAYGQAQLPLAYGDIQPPAYETKSGENMAAT